MCVGVYVAYICAMCRDMCVCSMTCAPMMLGCVIVIEGCGCVAHSVLSLFVLAFLYGWVAVCFLGVVGCCCCWR